MKIRAPKALAEPSAMTLFATAIALALFVYWPVLSQPFIQDDIDIQWILASAHARPLAAVFSDLLHRCLLPVYFRPLAAPIFLAMYACFGLSPAPLRVLIVVLMLLSAAQLLRLVKILTGSLSAGFAAALIYGISWIHWDTAAMTTNLPQAIAHVLFWQSLIMFAGSRPKWTAVDALVAMAPVTLALLFKEDVIVFPAFVMALAWSVPNIGARLGRNLALFAAWILAYLGYRLLDPQSFIGAPALRVQPLELFRAANYFRALALLTTSWLRTTPTATTLDGISRYFSTSPAAALAWLGVLVASGSVVGAISSRLSRAAQPARNARGVFILSLVGSVAAVAPYAAFGAVPYWNCHRLDLSCAALSLGLGLLANELGRRALKLGRPGTVAHALVGIFLVVKTAVFFRFPDYRLAPFSRLFTLHQTREAIEPIRAALERENALGDDLVFAGFDSSERIPMLLQALEGRTLQARSSDGSEQPRGAHWLIARQRAGEDVILTMTRSTDQRALRAQWPFEPRL